MEVYAYHYNFKTKLFAVSMQAIKEEIRFCVKYSESLITESGEFEVQ